MKFFKYLTKLPVITFRYENLPLVVPLTGDGAAKIFEAVKKEKTILKHVAIFFQLLIFTHVIFDRTGS